MAATSKTRSVTAQVPVELAERVDERSRLTHEALADVDADRVIDHQAVQAWADSLDSDTSLPLPELR
ncbi:CopG family transcriptional regulator [Pseudomonas citronellolis]|uniref:CopG family transcriptional regulator n=1 Tax=Pseudomonas citronellolis TaxID=53408 RepID=UPI00209EB703|nr:CopG family transcriptional regulator [Pseudomonas citronellolis]MCP1603959.1 putative transcriptional regulator [Pseudomonas citronellolis]MCP1654391.1 putative transcriptional regulator [Pseudomonas citronellolis]MCP1721617.1 putative transcriptional regulator [Pseudomonas citronellolis]